ncbi:Transcription factor IIIC subunit 5 HTH domain-containing protein [Dioscorea alata]|uniref:Transcription factor IIIC subunit 5 HTH domain-containing protein n=1 Tax=Dioscorea alata TaxID=55571 RepID=A0ACB7WJK6_DIOAL|nr:Transcription factor IIIC subunit 5 HTH domain-containing protein [Dioscorea alata]
MEIGSDSEPERASENPPSSSSIIAGGAVAGVLPEAEAFAVHYPGYPSSPSRAVHTLGGISELSKVRSLDSNNVELRFRPEDPNSHPAFGERRLSSSLLLKVSKPKNSGPESISASVVARVLRAYHFEGMVDYQHVVAVHAAEARKRKRPLNSDERLDFEKSGVLDSDVGDVIMMVPPLFSVKDIPEKIVLNPSANLFSKNMQRGVVEHRWEMDIEPCLAIDFNIENILYKRHFYFQSIHV